MPFEIEIPAQPKNQEVIAKFLKEDLSSDHLPMRHADVMTLSWNLLEICKTEYAPDDRYLIKKTNNGFRTTEDEETYKTRLESNLAHIGKLGADSHGNNPENLPVTILCMQEITRGILTDEEMDTILKKYHFTLSADSSSYLTQPYSTKKDELLAMAYDATKIKFISRVDLPDISKDHAEQARFQAVIFLDKKIQKKFVVVNAHQAFKLMNSSENSEALKDTQLILEHFQKMDMPCIITGDFNTKNIKTSNENGKLILGLNRNLIWDFEKRDHKLDSCDHIILNEKYYREFLPELRLKSKLDLKFFTRTDGNVKSNILSFLNKKDITSLNSIRQLRGDISTENSLPLSIYFPQPYYKTIPKQVYRKLDQCCEQHWCQTGNDCYDYHCADIDVIEDPYHGRNEKFGPGSHGNCYNMLTCVYCGRYCKGECCHRDAWRDACMHIGCAILCCPAYTPRVCCNFASLFPAGCSSICGTVKYLQFPIHYQKQIASREQAPGIELKRFSIYAEKIREKKILPAAPKEQAMDEIKSDSSCLTP